MNSSKVNSEMPAEMIRKLNEIRRQDQRVRIWTGFLRALTILLGAMLVAMAVDWLFVLHDEALRWSLTLVALGCAAAAFVHGCLLPLLRPHSLAEIAQKVDRAHPALEERYSTLAGFAQSTDAPELRGSQAMIQKVAEQARAMTNAVKPDAVVPKAALARARRFAWSAAGVFALLLVVDFPQVRILCERFWAPGSNISLTQLQARTGDVVIGKGESVTLEIASKGRPTDSASLFIRSSSGRNEVVPLRRSATNALAAFAYTQSSVSDSFEYRARSGDGQTEWHRVIVLERPKITQVKLRIIPPAYSRLPTVDEAALPRRVRALEGSRLEVSFQADQPLDNLQLKLSGTQTRTLVKSADNSYRFDAVLTNSLVITPVLTSTHHLDNQPKPTCDVQVYPDEPPSVTVLSPDNEITARPDDKVKIDFEAKDDIGLASAELVVNIKGDTNTTSVVIPIPLKESEMGARKLHKQVELDLAQFKLKQDQELSYVVRVTDTKQNLATSIPGDRDQEPGKDKQLAESDTAQNQSAAPKPPGQQTDDNHSPDAPKNNLAQSDKNSHIAMGAPPKTSPPNQDPMGNQPPPNNMSKRVLDAGQCSSCQPMRILVDEWGRSFEGQMREKLEIAIDPTLKLLDELLGKAGGLADSLLATGRSPEGLSQKQSPSLESAKDQLRQADRAVSDLKRVSQDTPYAFIGLQVHDIRESHITPARQRFSDVTLDAALLKQDSTNLEQASFQIKRARERLAELTRSYEAVKRDYKVADATQRLKKMHQIFLEDTQALLGSKKPTLNPQDRKVAEVSDEFTEKLRKLLEEQKKIMAELAKILADDPRLLHRYLALEQLEGTSLRDQMTLLAQRQQALAKQAGQWLGARDDEKAALLKDFTSSQAAEQNEVAALAAQMHENMTTWLPLDVPTTNETFVNCLNLAAEAARLAADATTQTNSETSDAGLATARKALEQLRLLQANLPGLEWIPESGQKISAFEANRMNETATLITRESGWIKKVEALKAGDYPQAAEVDQYRCTLETTDLSEKLDNAATSLGSLSAEISAKAGELNGTVHHQVLPEESGATDAFSRKSVKEAAGHQTEATTAFATAEKQFDDLLHLIIAKLDASPPPTDPGQNKSLEDLLAMLQDEKKAAESLGIPCRPINVSIQKDWLKSGSGSNASQGRAQARAAQAQARHATDRMQRVSDDAKKLALQRASELAAKQDGLPQSGPKRPANSWNTLASQLGDEIRQGRDSVPPEQYRQAIEQYFNTISQTPKESSKDQAPGSK